MKMRPLTGDDRALIRVLRFPSWKKDGEHLVLEW